MSSNVHGAVPGSNVIVCSALVSLGLPVAEAGGVADPIPLCAVISDAFATPGARSPSAAATVAAQANALGFNRSLRSLAASTAWG